MKISKFIKIKIKFNYIWRLDNPFKWCLLKCVNFCENHNNCDYFLNIFWMAYSVAIWSSNLNSAICIFYILTFSCIIIFLLKKSFWKHQNMASYFKDSPIINNEIKQVSIQYPFSFPNQNPRKECIK